MSFDSDMDKLIQKYLAEVKGEEIELIEIMQRPRWRRVWYWWLAREHFEGKPMPNMTIDDCKNIYGD